MHVMASCTNDAPSFVDAGLGTDAEANPSDAASSLSRADAGADVPSQVFAGSPATPDGGLANLRDASLPSVLGDAGVQSGASVSPPADAANATVSKLVDPGAGPWTQVNREDVARVCHLDIALLDQADKTLQSYNAEGVPWAVIRYGRLCYVSHADAAADEAYSTTKTLGALVLGIVSHETRDLPRTGPKTGPLTDEDRVDQWLEDFPYNKDARVAHVLSMVAHNANLSLGQKTMTYDTTGGTQINSLSSVMNAAIQQDATRLGQNLEELVQRFLFGPLGMKDSTWSLGSANKTLGYSWNTTALDMARLGLLMLHGGVWNGTRVLSQDYLYRMTHPAFEDANTGYGYLTWLNASSNFTFGSIPGAPWGRLQTAATPGPCAPVSVHREHPHGLSDSPDCNYAAPYSCTQKYDVGAWAAVGLLGQVIAGHPGLDLLITAKNLTPLLGESTTDLGFGPETPKIVWDAVVPAIIAGDPTYQGDAPAFCEAYGANEYAPDLNVDETNR